MNLHLAQHHGMCFGVRDALRATHSAAMREPVTMLGQLVHNPVVADHLQTLGVRTGHLEQLESAQTQRVVITAHGASDQHRSAWQQAGHVITDTTCPLVRKAHAALAALVQEGYHPVVIGQRDHAEVRGLIGDFPEATVVLSAEQVPLIPERRMIGVVSQTTQPLDLVLHLVSTIKARHPLVEVRFIDTVCHPTKQRQTALEEICRSCQVVVVIGGRNSNNTRQLTEKATRLGVRAHQVETAEDLQADWFAGVTEVGVTAGTSTLDETVRQVMDRLKVITDESN
ncbi:MAG: 4-hydroxy-3-methylbut-2-enyl diphosphate reductase [Verrucomicrobia bacterium]|nr:4-hydroxy-3-methylbut-2-enyl diphosphate reductase [Verrucomicrobiota bacterium]